MKRFALLSLVMFALATAAAAQDLPLLTKDAPVGPRDVLEVSVLEDKSISGRVTVSEDGLIALNVLEKVQVAGLTPSQIESRLKSLLEADYLAKATVSVQVVEFASKPISVLGAVLRPGLISATGNTTLLQAITQAGGLAPNHGKDLFVLRTGLNGLTEQVAVPIEDLLINGNPDVNIPLAPNDLVNVPVDAPLTVYVAGEVSRPGKVQFRSSQTPTLLQAIADSGGTTDRASRNALVTRVENGQSRTIKVSFGDIIKGRKPDFVLKDNDTVWIGESLF
ncbi:MAG TPA: SLBB domain-containing protein [Thermoanaerobaculia bacterium]|nr:SLBB domain-containing protein [Thermoanaerobaculia bacterium]